MREPDGLLISMDKDAARWIKRLDLQPHPEGGWFRETLRTEHCTTIYYLLEPGTFSGWHRVRGADEVWHHYAGDLLALFTIEGGEVQRRLLGDEVHHHAVSEDVWQAAQPATDGWSLVGCTVAPAFTFDRFELGARDALHAQFPSLERWIVKFTRR